MPISKSRGCRLRDSRLRTQTVFFRRSPTSHLSTITTESSSPWAMAATRKVWLWLNSARFSDAKFVHIVFSLKQGQHPPCFSVLKAVRPAIGVQSRSGSRMSPRFVAYHSRNTAASPISSHSSGSGTPTSGVGVEGTVFLISSYSR
jgi:hypothetical protein